jgi:hypothetical protein
MPRPSRTWPKRWQKTGAEGDGWGTWTWIVRFCVLNIWMV